MDEKAKRRVLGLFSYGLYAIGVRDGERMNAFTANWVTQVAFEPPMIAVSVENDGASVAMMRESKVFSVNVFDGSQRREAARLARPYSRAPEKLDEFEYETRETGAPLLTDCLGYVECRIVDEIVTGDHTLFVGEVVGADVFREGEPLTMASAGFTYAG